MGTKINIKNRLPSRHVTEGCAPHRCCFDAMNSTIKFCPFDIAGIFKKTPCVADLKPSGRYVAKDMLEVGGIKFLMKTFCVLATHHVSGTFWKYVRQVGFAASGVVTRRVARMGSSAMRIFKRAIIVAALGVSVQVAPALAFDGAPVNSKATIPVASPAQAGVAGALGRAVPPAATKRDDTSLTALQYAAEEGHPVAQWRLGRMYADGNGVVQDDVRAFEYFSRIANAHAEDNPSEPQAQIVGNAFVALGRYYLHGIPNSKIAQDLDRAREMFSYAASYFGNADAQYDLARLYLNTPDASREDFRYGARWLGLAAQKGQHQAQALLGQMLFNGDRLPQQQARGLMWLTLARDSAGPDEAWIKESYNRAVARASDADRAMTLQMLQQWVQGRRD